MWVFGALVVAVLATSLAGCSGDDDSASPATPEASSRPGAPIVTIGAGQEVSPVPAWSAPEIEVDEDNIAQLKIDASAALEAGELFGEDDDAIPLYLALREHASGDAEVAAGFQQALGAVIERGDDALAAIDDDPAALRRAHQVA